MGSRQPSPVGGARVPRDTSCQGSRSSIQVKCPREGVGGAGGEKRTNSNACTLALPTIFVKYYTFVGIVL